MNKLLILLGASLVLAGCFEVEKQTSYPVQNIIETDKGELKKAVDNQFVKPRTAGKNIKRESEKNEVAKDDSTITKITEKDVKEVAKVTDNKAITETKENKKSDSKNADSKQTAEKAVEAKKSEKAAAKKAKAGAEKAEVKTETAKQIKPLSDVDKVNNSDKAQPSTPKADEWQASDANKDGISRATAVKQEESQAAQSYQSQAAVVEKPKREYKLKEAKPVKSDGPQSSKKAATTETSKKYLAYNVIKKNTEKEEPQVSNFSMEELRLGAQQPQSAEEIRFEKLRCRHPLMSQAELEANGCLPKRVR